MPHQNGSIMPRKYKGGRPATHDWQKWDAHLGVIPDTHLAKLIGCTTFAVLARRRKLRVRAYQPKWGT